MEEKLYIQDLIKLLAEKQSIETTEAEAFVRAVFDIIKDALETDRVVKIKGLGTFKLTDVDSRESINVNTGERIRIESHTKISFIPDTQMRDMINKPFSHFETVILNEGVTFDDMFLAENEEEKDVEPEATNLRAAEPAIELPVEKEKETETPSSVVETPSHRHTALFYGLSIAFIVILLASGLVFFMDNPRLFEAKEGEGATHTISIEKAEAILPADTAEVKEVVADTPLPMDTTETIITGVRKGSNTVIADSTSYIIVGTMTTYKLQAGETLTMVSKRFYETKDLWPYLVMHNRSAIKNPNRVPSGTVIRIPALRDKNF